MRGTSFIYSSHDRSNFIHDQYIVQRALRGHDNQRILFLPMSETVENGNEHSRQEFSYGSFRWFFSFYRRFGLEFLPFYWSHDLQKQDVDLLWHQLYTSEVVILGGGHPPTGLWRYKQLGAQFAGEAGKFGRILHERRQRGLLTVGFSAGADQLSQYLFRRSYDPFGDTDAFGLVRNVMVTLHHEPSRNHDLYEAATRFRDCMVFGLPNDAGLNSDWGRLPSGNLWQVIEFVIDKSWDNPRDAMHIKTRSGALIEHIGCNGQHWAFQGGDTMVRIQSPDGHFNEAWFTIQGRLHHYWSREPSSFGSVAQVLASH